MYALYGAKKCGGMLVPTSLCGSGRPPEPEAVENDRSSRCLGCPYPRHGLFCWTDSETCLRTEMEEIYAKSRRSGATAY
jgi:hypothetical protein